MSFPEVNQTFVDGGLGVAVGGGERTVALIGVASEGLVNSVNSIGDKGTIISTLGRGKLAELAAQIIAARGSVIAVPVLPSVVGTVGATTLTGSGTGTVTGAKVPAKVVRVKIILGGTPGTMTFQVAVGSGAYSATVASTADPYSYRVPRTLTQLVFANISYVANDVYTLNADGTISRTGSGTATALDNSVSNPIDDFALRVKISKAGALGVATFAYSLDGGNNYSGDILVPGGGVYVIPETGVKLTFAGTFVLDDVYAMKVTAPSFSNSDATAALDALTADARKWFCVGIVGQATSAANAASLAGAIDAKMAAAEAVFRYARAVVECPHDADTGGAINDAAVIAAFASFASVNGRTGVAVGDCGLVSQLTGRTERRGAMWPTLARLAGISAGEEAGWVGRGALTGVTSLYRDDAASGGALHAQRFITLRTHIGRAGYYVSESNTMAVAGSDYGTMDRGRVIDAAASASRAVLLKNLLATVRIDPKTGKIDERDAQKIESEATQAVRDAVVSTGDASDAKVILSRDANLLSTGDQPVDTRVVPLAKLRRINNEIGFAQTLEAA